MFGSEWIGRAFAWRTAAASAALLLASIAPAHANAFTPGNLVVVRVGDGTSALTNVGTAVFLDEYTPSGTLVQSIAMPTAAAGANRQFCNSGTATSEGFLTLTSNGQYLINAGYDAPLGTNNVATSPSTLNPRVIARTALNGTTDTSTGLGDAYSGGNIRSAASDNGSQFWVSGNANGMRYAANLGATTSTQLNTTPPTNTRVIDIFAGQLYVSSASSAFQGVSIVGSGLPTTGGQTVALLNGFPTTTGPSSYDYFFADANTLYVADDRPVASGGGIQKWTAVSGIWSMQYVLAPATGGCRGLTGVVNGGVATLWATTTTSSANDIVTVTDTGASAAVMTVATTGTNTALRGIRLLPGGTSGPGVAFCFGDGSGTACPCGNNSPVGNNEGCLSSIGMGGKLGSLGTPSLAADTLVLTGSQMPNSSALYFQGTTQIGAGAGSSFGDGLRCAGGSVVRLGTKTNVGGASQYPGAGSPPVSVKGLVTAPGVRDYQCWYRNAAAFCTTSTFNLTNGLEITWTP
jgi:hypothetical protein